MMLAKDEELGKRNDDHKPLHTGALQRWYRPFARKRRIAAFVVACYLVYLFIHNIPTDLKPAMPRPSYSGPQQDPYQQPNWNRKAPPGLSEARQAAPGPPPPSKAPSNPGELADAAVRYYEGPVKFYYLASSLRSTSKLGGQKPGSRNVLFGASDLQSAARIIPLACEMSKWKRNIVHMAFFGREEIELADLKSINGVDKTTCDVHWHDARPDYASFSSSKRMEISVAGALSHIDTFMHPQVLITADSAGEDDFFARSMRSKAKGLNIPVVEIPLEGAERLAWMTRLDSTALHNWHSSGIDVVIQAPTESSGSLLRLLKSLEHADYAGFNPPRLTIELPPKMDQETEAFVNSFQWPPMKYQHSAHSNELTLRRRIPDRRVDADEAAIRFIESFYPTSVNGPHVLLLSPQAELSPAFFHYLKYYLLEYKYSAPAADTDYLMGISLESPSIHLNGSMQFVAPHGGTMKTDDMSPFLWQAPNSNAALYFADKWMEIHSFLTQRHAALRDSRTKDHHQNREKKVSERFPAWTEYFLDLMQSRAYAIQYPGHTTSSAASDQGLVIVHNDLYQLPEEFARPTAPFARPDEPLPTESVLTSSSDYLATHSQRQTQPENHELPLLQTLLTLLPPLPASEPDDHRQPSLDTILQPEPVPAISTLLILGSQGDATTQESLYDRAIVAANVYRREAGGCPESEAKMRERNIVLGSADDLFCLDSEEEVESVEPESSTQPDQTESSSNNQSTPSETSIMSSANAPAITDPPAPPTRIFGSGGAASTVDRVINPEKYQETALAGFKNKLQGLKGPSPPASSEASTIKLTPLESKELEDWQSEVRKSDKAGQAVGDTMPGRTAVRQGRIPVYQDSDPEPGSVHNFPDVSPPTQGRPAGGKLGRIPVLTDDDPEPGSRRKPAKSDPRLDSQSFKLPGVPAINADPDGDGRVRVEDLRVTVKSDGSASVLDADGDEEVVKLGPEAASDLVPKDAPSKAEPIHGSGGAAATIARVLDAAQYQATAKAGFEKKIKGGAAKAGVEHKVKGLKSGEEVRAQEAEAVAQLKEKDREAERQREYDEATGRIRGEKET